jgi:hypothetical protein
MYGFSLRSSFPRIDVKEDSSDRVQVRGLGYADRTLPLDMVVAGEEDAAASPSTKVRKSFRLSDGKLKESATEELGARSLASSSHKFCA